MASSVFNIPPTSTPINPQSLTIQPGSSTPLGASPLPANTGINFAVYAPKAASVSLCLFNADHSPITEAPMHKSTDTNDGTWHAQVTKLPLKDVVYGYKVNGGTNNTSKIPRWDSSRVLLDPWATLVSGRRKFGVRDAIEKFDGQRGSEFRGTFDFISNDKPFDWGGAGYKKPNHHMKDLIIYEMPIRCFTADASSGLPEPVRGSYLGVAEKIPHLLELGINAVEFLPVFEWDELEFQRIPNPRQHMTNIWGYSHLNFFAPMSRFAAGGGGPTAAAMEFKQMVKQLHAAGIEVILDVVYNHTVEGGDDDPYTLSWRGIDSDTYYQQDFQTGELLNYSGCGNTVNANHSPVHDMILASLKWWVKEYHVDGFRFDLASCLCRDAHGNPLPAPPLIKAISKDPELSGIKMIAEPWDIGMYQVGTFPNWDIWAEWNGKYRDDVRRFIKGDAGVKPGFATRLAGSADLYHNHNRKPYHSINFVIAHDGFTLADLVSYNDKHNELNGEGGRDGTNDNFSWNCGVEGATTDPTVLALRARQMRNMHLALMLSQGTPMILSGDEYAATRDGNNNWYGHDSALTHFKWDQMEAAKKADENNDGWFRYYSSLIKFRRACPLLGRENFLEPKDVTWHEDRWDDPESRFLAFTLHDTVEDAAWGTTNNNNEKNNGSGGSSSSTIICPRGDLYAAFNTHDFEVTAHLPPPPSGKKWCRLVDTNLPSPRDWTDGGNGGVAGEYKMASFSSILLVAK